MRACHSLWCFLAFAILGGLLGTILTIGPSADASAAESVAQVVTPGAYRPPLHPAIVATFQMLASLAALIGLERSDRAE